MKLKRRTRVVPPAFTVIDETNGNVSVGYITRANLAPRSKWRLHLHTGMSISMDELRQVLELVKDQLGE